MFFKLSWNHSTEHLPPGTSIPLWTSRFSIAFYTNFVKTLPFPSQFKICAGREAGVLPGSSQPHHLHAAAHVDGHGMLCALSVPLCQKFQQQGVVPQGVLCQLLAVLSALYCGGHCLVDHRAAAGP